MSKLVNKKIYKFPSAENKINWEKKKIKFSSSSIGNISNKTYKSKISKVKSSDEF